MSSYRTLNPATEQQIRSYPEIGWEEVEQRGRKAREAFLRWRELPFAERKRLFLKLAEKLNEQQGSLAALITLEMGKPITEAEAEVGKCALGCSFYAERGEHFLREEAIPTDAGKSYVRYDPLGTVLAIMPWNFPFWQVFRCSVPALLAGNVVLLKHSPNVPGCALKIAELFHAVGFPDGVFQSIFCDNPTVARLIESPWAQAVSLTGSDRAGSQVAETAGRALKKVVLELGGSDPFIVLDEADLEKCIPLAIRCRFLNAGQSCIAAKRFILTKKIAPAFEEAFLPAVRAQKVGDPMDRATKIGPLARQDLLENLARQVQQARKEGANCLVGGDRLPGKGYFYLPTVFKDVTPEMVVCQEEVFGPVASLFVVANEAEAIALANQTAYGLGASLWTKDAKKGERLAREIEAGSVFINGMTHSDPRLPFGGIKRSGFGRELSSFGMREFTNVKTVWIA